MVAPYFCFLTRSGAFRDVFLLSDKQVGREAFLFPRRWAAATPTPARPPNCHLRRPSGRPSRLLRAWRRGQLWTPDIVLPDFISENPKRGLFRQSASRPGALLWLPAGRRKGAISVRTSRLPVPNSEHSAKMGSRRKAPWGQVLHS